MGYLEMVELLRQIGEIVWGPPTWALLGLTGAYLSYKTNWFQLTKFGHYCSNTIGKLFSGDKAGDGDITPFQAFNTAMAATMGVGTLVGTTTAIVFGGPGAVFWMWAIGFFGITTKFAEITLAIYFREKNDQGMVLGGPMQYISKGLGWKWLAAIFAIAGSIAAFGIGNLVQANTLGGAFETAYGVPRWVTGTVLVILTAAVILGGLKRLAKVAERLIPFFGLFMMIFCAAIIIENAAYIPNALSLIVVGAFTYQGAIGGFVGSGVATAIRFGLMRGIFSNEAGLGSAPIAHATAKTDHPSKQGLWGAFEVFLDTHVMCTFVALAIITSGVWLTPIPVMDARTGVQMIREIEPLISPEAGVQVIRDVVDPETGEIRARVLDPETGAPMFLENDELAYEVRARALDPETGSPMLQENEELVYRARTLAGDATPLFLATIRSSLFGETLGSFLGVLAIFGFGWTTMLGWAFYGEKCLEYLFGTKSNVVYRIVFLPPILVGVFGIVPVWAVADILNAGMAIPNMIGLLGLSGLFAAITKSYFKGERWVPFEEDPNYYKNFKE